MPSAPPPWPARRSILSWSWRLPGLSEWPDELMRRGMVIEVEAGRMAFRHALVRDAFYGETPMDSAGHIAPGGG
mgnify:CR=1 FL=1